MPIAVAPLSPGPSPEPSAGRGERDAPRRLRRLWCARRHDLTVAHDLHGVQWLVPGPGDTHLHGTHLLAEIQALVRRRQAFDLDAPHWTVGDKGPSRRQPG